MIITCLGHASFLLELENGYRIVTDPYDSSVGYPMRHTRANAVLVSHQHHDHNAVDTVSGYETVVDAAGSRTLAPGVQVTAIDAFHDDCNGAKRGKTLLFLLEAEGLRVAHLGDLGADLSPSQEKALGRVDILMIPTGGFFTIDAEQAHAIAMRLKPAVTLPMHYRTACNADWPIAAAEAYTSLCPSFETLPLLRVVKADLACQPKTVILTAAD